ncbi:MAG: hypothetical protein IPM54_21100 [Polyangiaceae bacterium]|nr:hypothetical protein [Polyangiaceae bacterium]
MTTADGNLTAILQSLGQFCGVSSRVHLPSPQLDVRQSAALIACVSLTPQIASLVSHRTALAMLGTVT